MKWYGDIPVTRRKYAKILIVFLLMILACFVNPYGIKGVSYPFLLFTQISSQAHESMKRVSELQPTLTMKHIEDVFFHYRFLGFLACLTFLLNIRKLNVTFIMLYTGFWAVSLKAWRNTALFALIAAPIAISNINNVSLKVKKFVDSRVILKHGCRVLISAVLIVFMIFWTVNGVTNKYYVKEGSIERFGTGVSKFAYPEGAVRFIEENNLEGNMFNDAAIGGYLIWRLSPERKIFVDGRWEVRYGDEFMNRIDQSCMDIESFNTLMDEYNVNYIILTHISRESVLILSDLYKDRKWALVYFDDVGSLFIRNTLQNRSIIENNKIDFSSEMKDFTGRVKGYQHNNFQKALFFVTVGLIDNARYEFRKAIAINARFFEAYYNLALSYGGVDWKEMRVLLEKAAVINAHFNGLHYNLAVACEKTGDNQNAIKEYEKEIKINPEDVSSYKNLGLIYYKRAEYEKTVPLWEKYLQLLPGASDAVLIKAELDKIREK